MTVILQENHNAPVVSIQIFVKSGSIHEGKYLGTGVSHFVEHVIDDGTLRRSRAAIDELVEYIGNISNAYTWKDHTKYYITTSIADFNVALDVISDYIQHATFPESEVVIQRGVILNEFNQDADEPYRRLHNLYYETAYQQHPIRYPVGGYRELFEQLTRADLVDFYTRTYVPENVIFVAVGDFDISATLAKVTEAFCDFPRRPAPIYELPQEPTQQATRRVQEYADIKLAYLLMGFHTVGILHPDTYALDLASSILGEGESSRMSKTIKSQQQLVHYIGVWSETYTYDVGHLAIEAEMDPENISVAEEAILRELCKLQTEPVLPEELQRAKTIEESYQIFSRQTVEDQATISGMNELMTSDIHFSEKYLQQLKAVDFQSVMRVAQRYFTRENMTVTVLMPREKGERARG